jgi:hypothetical protein
MSERKQDTGRGRREVLRLAGLGAVGGAAGLVTPARKAEAAAAPTTGGYRVTEHVETYYRLARF